MNKKGFTLVEVLIVVALLAVIFSISVPRIINIIGSSDKRNFETKKSLIVNAAEMYVQDNHYELELTDAYYVSVNDLLKKNYLEPDLAPGEGNCNASYTEGCVVNGTDGTILNNNIIKVEVKNKRYIGVWVSS